MRYYEYQFKLKCEEDMGCELETASDVLSAMLAEVGFEAFEASEEGLKAYIQTQLLDEDALDACLTGFPLPGWKIASEQREAEYANWNEQWEREGFQPIVIGDKLCIHDALHTTLPETGETLPATTYELIVSPKLAFGSGTHPTTRQLLEALLELDVKGKHVIDAGCGTGILGMLCKLRGADKVSGYDIDEWSTENTKDNAKLNQLEMDVWLGDASVLPAITEQNGQADLLIANINRNILLNDMEAFSMALNKEQGTLLLSGFYKEDVPYLLEKTNSLGLKLIEKRVKDGWVILQLQR